MKLYYRADTRSPKEIFSNGFTPRQSEPRLGYQGPWWIRNLREWSSFLQLGLPMSLEKFQTSWGIDERATRVVEARETHVVCFTTEFEAAPIFPTNEGRDIYVYVMALPEATIPDDCGKIDACEFDLDCQVFDLHELQIRQSMEILKHHSNANPASVATLLCGYEAFAKKVEANQIICAVKCRRTNALKTAGVSVHTSEGGFDYPFDRTFKIGAEVLCNPNYVEHDTTLKERAIDKLRAVKAKGTQPTSSGLAALNASEITYDESKITMANLFWRELVHLNFISAGRSVFESIRYFFISLYVYIIEESFFSAGNKEIVVLDYDLAQPVASNAAQSNSLFSFSLFGKNSTENNESTPLMTEGLRPDAGM